MTFQGRLPIFDPPVSQNHSLQYQTMKRSFFVAIGILLLTACTPQNDKENATEDVPEGSNSDMHVTQPADNPITDHPADDPGNELHPFFPEAASESFTNCHSEKGPFEDYDNGEIIHELMVAKYELFKFELDPEIGGQFKLGDKRLILKGIQRHDHQGHTIYIYAVGLNVGAEIDPEVEAVEYRALVMKGADVKGSHFVGGYVKEKEEEEVAVCRQVTFEEGKMKMTYMEEGSVNAPAQFKEEESRAL